MFQASISLDTRTCVILVLLTLLILPSLLFAQKAIAKVLTPQVQWIKENATPIRTVKPTDEDFSDLMPLIKKIGNARVVLLGEATHREGNVFLLKSRLIRFLHQVMGFEILAWECGLYNCNRMNTALHSDTKLDEAMSLGFFGIWSKSQQVYPTIEYVKSTRGKPNQMTLVGFDNQLTSQDSTQHLHTELQAFFKQAGVKVLSNEAWEQFKQLLVWRTLMQMSKQQLHEQKKVLNTLIAVLADSKSKLHAHHAKKEILFWHRVVKGQRTVIESITAKKDPTRMLNLRDAAMADNLIWLAEKVYPKKKIIVWAATLHIMRNIGQVKSGIPQLKYDQVVPMGHIVHQQLKDQFYSIGFSAFDGEKGAPWDKKVASISPAPSDSLEAFCHQSGSEMLFVDLKGILDQKKHWLNQKIKARPLAYLPMTAIWPNHLDAIIYLNKVTRSTQRNNNNEYKNKKNKKVVDK